MGHYYHWIGETFLGLWRIWKHWEWSRGVKLPELKTIGFAKTYSWDELGIIDEKYGWEDHAGVNRYFMDTLL